MKYDHIRTTSAYINQSFHCDSFPLIVIDHVRRSSKIQDLSCENYVCCSMPYHIKLSTTEYNIIVYARVYTVELLFNEILYISYVFFFFWNLNILT